MDGRPEGGETRATEKDLAADIRTLLPWLARQEQAAADLCGCSRDRRAEPGDSSGCSHGHQLETRETTRPARQSTRSDLSPFMARFVPHAYIDEEDQEACGQRVSPLGESYAVLGERGASRADGPEWHADPVVPGNRHQRPVGALLDPQSVSWTDCDFLRATVQNSAGLTPDAITTGDANPLNNRPAFDVLCTYLTAMWDALDASDGFTTVNARPFAGSGGARLSVRGWPTPSVPPPSFAVFMHMLLLGAIPTPFSGMTWFTTYAEQSRWSRVRGTHVWVAMSGMRVLGKPVGFSNYRERDTVGLAVRIVRESAASLRDWEAAALADSNSAWRGEGLSIPTDEGDIIDLVMDALRREGPETIPMNLVGVTGNWAYEAVDWAALTFPEIHTVLIDRETTVFFTAALQMARLRQAAVDQWNQEQERLGGRNVALMDDPAITRTLLLDTAKALIKLGGMIVHEYAHLVWAKRLATNSGGGTSCCGPQVFFRNPDRVILRPYDFRNGGSPLNTATTSKSRQRHAAIHMLQGWTTDLLRNTTDADSGATLGRDNCTRLRMGDYQWMRRNC